MTCQAYENRLDELEDYLEGHLDAMRAKALSEHLSGCAHCREALDVAGMSVRLMRAGAEPVPAASGPFWTRLQARVRAEEEKLIARRDLFGSIEWLAWRTVSAALLAAVILGGYLIAQPPVPSGNDQQQAEVFQEPEHPRNADDVLMTMAARPNGR